jgi:Flp pilus assembly protein TadG
MGYSKRRADAERGANLVEFAVLAPLLIILVLGIVELGWLFGQFNDVRHGVREGARFAAVDGGDEAAIQQRVCTSMDGLSAGMSALRVQLTDSGTAASVSTIRVEADIDSLSGLPIITSFLPASLDSEVDFALEQDSTNWGSTGLVNVTC